MATNLLSRAVRLSMQIGVLASSISNRGGGIFGAMVGQSRALDKYFHIKPKIFGLHDNLSEQDRAAWNSLPLTVCPITGPSAFGYSPKLVSALHKANLDLLHVHGLWMYPSIASSIWGRRTSKSYIISTHGMLDSWALHHSYWKKKIAGSLFQNQHLKGAACVQALTQAEAQSIRDFGLRNPICIIPLGVDIPERVSRANLISQGPKVLLYLGRLHPKKGLNNLIHAWHRVQHKKQLGSEAWVLRIAGWAEGAYETTLKSLSRDLNVENCIQFVGPKFGADKESSFCEANAFILPSVSEGLPLVILEAWAHRLPVLMTPQCNLPGGFQAGAAISIDLGVDGIVAGLENLISKSNAERDRMGEIGIHLVQTSFAWRTVADKMYSVYRWILKKDRIPDCVFSA